MKKGPALFPLQGGVSDKIKIAGENLAV